MMSTRTEAHFRLTLACALIVALGCHDAQAPGSDQPPERLDVLGSLIVSDPTASTGAAAAVTGAAAEDGVVYASLPPGSVPDGEWVVVENRRTGALATAPMVDGGFDPVPIVAIAGDTLALRIHVPGDSGDREFIAVVPPHQPPVVVRTDPPPQKQDVPLNAVLLVVFSEPLDPATLTDSAVQLLLGDAPVEGTLAFGNDAHLTLTFTPAEPLAAGTQYTLLLTRSLADLNGEAFEASVTISFTTRAEFGSVVAVYERTSPETSGYYSRYVLYDGGGFELQYYHPGSASAFSYSGRYLRADSTITFSFDDNWGTWEANGTLAGDSLVVEYNIDMAMSDFEDGVYVLNSTQPAGWEALAPMPEARWGAGVASLDGVVYVAGGATDLGAGWIAPPEILAYDPTDDTWRTVGTLLHPEYGPEMAVVGNLIFVVGAELQIFDPATGTVVAGPPMPTPRGGFAVTVLDDRIHAIGGAVDGADSLMGAWTNTHEVFDPSTGAWSSRTPMRTARGVHGAATVDGKIYVTGGVGDSVLASFEVYDPATDSWTSYGSPPARWGVAVAALGGKVYVFGGAEYQTQCCGGPITSVIVDRFDPATGSWEQAVPMLTARESHGATVVGGAIYVIGGSSSGNAADALSVNERFTPGR